VIIIYGGVSVFSVYFIFNIINFVYVHKAGVTSYKWFLLFNIFLIIVNKFLILTHRDCKTLIGRITFTV
ncbi:hypothetical protein L9F63_002306, partial [Diploptera punctata]